jgi:ribonucleoside-diphosphate reductase beta chain
MEGTQFYGLFGMVLSLYRQNKFPGIGQMFRYTLRDESNHIELFRNLLMDLVEENRKSGQPSSSQELTDLMAEGVALEKEFIRDCLPVGGVGLTASEFMQYIDFIADRRLEGVRSAPSTPACHQPAALAGRDDGHQEGAKLLRRPRHRIPKSVFPRRRL